MSSLAAVESEERAHESRGGHEQRQQRPLQRSRQRRQEPRRAELRRPRRGGQHRPSNQVRRERGRDGADAVDEREGGLVGPPAGRERRRGRVEGQVDGLRGAGERRLHFAVRPRAPVVGLHAGKLAAHGWRWCGEIGGTVTRGGVGPVQREGGTESVALEVGSRWGRGLGGVGAAQ